MLSRRKLILINFKIIKEVPSILTQVFQLITNQKLRDHKRKIFVDLTTAMIS